MKNSALLPLVLLLSACSLSPDYVRPEMPVQQAWAQDYPDGPEQQEKGPAHELVDVAWRTFFTDAPLKDLIEKALEHNRDLRVTALNIEVARASYRVTSADLFPEVDTTVSGTGQHTPRALSISVPQEAQTTHQYNANLGVTAFEFDLFGRLHSLNEQALESYLATAEARSATQIALISEVANAYLSLLGDRKLLSLSERTLESRLKSLELIERRLRLGMSNELDRAQARTAVETARAARVRYIRLVAQDSNALQLLVGTPINSRALASDIDNLQLAEPLPVGLPSDVLLRRPDILQAEHALKAANANIGAARAAFFPRVSLTAIAGLASPALSSLWDADSHAWTFVPGITLPIFDAGRNQANLDAARTTREIAVARYEKAIQSAFREVSDGLIARRTLVSQVSAQQSLVDAASTSFRLSEARYRQGVDSHLEVLDAERSLFGAQQDLIRAHVEQMSNLISLYKALGGGRT